MPRYFLVFCLTAVILGIFVHISSKHTTQSSDQTDSDTVIILESYELGRYNPILGHGRSGDSHIYQGLYSVETGVFDRQPKLIPKLASGLAITSNNKVWTVSLRTGVTFSDGSSFGAEDVVATYQALIDPRSASPEISTWDNIEKVIAKENSVQFILKEPLADFDRRLINGIAPSEAFNFKDLGPAGSSSLNNKPLGTGPYVLSELRPDQAVLTARENYWGTPPQVKKIIIRYTADDNTRAQQLRAGEADGTVLPAELATTFKSPDFNVFSIQSGDWRAISLPAGHPVAGDEAIRLAVNYAVNRENMVKHVLKGHARANSTFLSPVYGKAYDPVQEFSYNTARAKKILDDAGWKLSTDGIRVRDGQRASFEVIYYPNRDRSRRDLTLAVAADLRKVGIEVIPSARDSKSVTREVYATTPVMLGGGGSPYSVDGQIYHILHSKYAITGGGANWDNASDYSNPKIDHLLDAARIEKDPQKRDEIYRLVQKEYHHKPAMLQLVYMNHVYVQKEQGFKNVQNIFEPHTHGVGFGPWFAIEEWEK